MSSSNPLKSNALIESSWHYSSIVYKALVVKFYLLINRLIYFNIFFYLIHRLNNINRILIQYVKWNGRDLELRMTSKPCFGTTVRRSANNRNYKNYEITHCLNKAHYNNVSYSFTHNKLAILYFGLVIYLYNLDTITYA